ncbi:tetratricopeptide repeat protein [Kordia sp. YSTF-M3]|uniref:Tetratricopeptide repeat protein n=1 Tax=Kordia aestuariivivens TaxID=2759037 RepID=A0ABR7QAZ3_9FLAO|nr:tetratricopeptide repeat protein [Kordia aestuariivivens]MBC8755668.1 tetratricopeptide repeat protein [Kordia aestuariivivens]
MNKLFFTLIFIIFFNFSNAQTSKKIIQNDLKELSIDSLKKGFYQYQKTNPIVAKEYLLSLLKKASNKNTALKKHKIHYQLASIFSTLRNKDSALHHINIAIKEVENDEELVFNHLYLKGSIYYEFGDYIQAIEYYTKVYDIAKKKNDLFAQANVANDIALIKTQIGDNADALNLIKKSIPFYENLVKQEDGEKYSVAYINSLMTISDIYTNLFIDKGKSEKKYLDSAHYYNTIAIDKSLHYNDNEAFAISLRLKGIIHHEEGNIEQSTTDLIKAEDLIYNLHLPNRLLILYLYRGKNYYVKGNYDKAITYFTKTDSLIKQTKADFPDLQELYILMAKSYEQKSDSENAIKYFNLFYQKDAKNDDLSQQGQEKLYKKYDVVVFKDKIDLLQNNLEEKKYNHGIIVFSLLFIIIIIIGYYKRRQSQNSKQFQLIVEELKNPKDKKSSSKEINISKENVLKILQGLDSFEKNEQFLKKNCSLNFVANKTNTNSTYLSKVIQIHKQKKFIQYITDLRIDYALEKLQTDKKFRAYNIKSIASELGYNSAESFSKDFKRRTKLYPSYYIKKLNETAS